MLAPDAPAAPPIERSDADARRIVSGRGALLAAGAAGCLAVGLLDPSTAPFPACPWRALTGIDCPGCGATRALHALLRGDVATAVDHNVLLVALVVVAAVGVVVAATRRAARRPPLRVADVPSGAGIAAALGGATIVAAFWLLRVAGPESMRWLASGT